MLMRVRDTRLSDEDKAVIMEALAPIAERRARLTRRSQALLAAAGEDCDGRHWYVLRVAHHAEKAVDNLLKEAGIERWLPISEVVTVRRSGRGNRPCDVRAVLAWPGYIFVKVVNLPQTWAALAKVDGVFSVIGTAERPAPVSDMEVLKLKAWLEEDEEAIEILTDALEVGEAVTVDDGPFASFPGTVVEWSDNGRVKIEVLIFGREVLVDLDLAQISKSD
jgi:transcriptional antiterminator NusG